MQPNTNSHKKICSVPLISETHTGIEVNYYYSQVGLTAYQRRKLKKERNQRNLIEGKFGQGKNVYGLSDIKAKRSDTSESWIATIFFVMNLVTLLKIADKYAIFCAYFKNRCQVLIDKLLEYWKRQIYSQGFSLPS